MARGRSNTVFSAGFFAEAPGWDFAVRIALGGCQAGTTDAGEVLATVARIRGTASWTAEWSARATQLAATAEQRADDGEVDFARYADALREIGYDGVTIYELIDMEPPLPRLHDDISTFERWGWAPACTHG